MTEAIELALIATSGSFLTGVIVGTISYLTSYFNNRQRAAIRSKERKEDFARQDAIAGQVEQVAVQAREATVLSGSSRPWLTAKTRKLAPIRGWCSVPTQPHSQCGAMPRICGAAAG